LRRIPASRFVSQSLRNISTLIRSSLVYAGSEGS
jgi:hypothetical protein